MGSEISQKPLLQAASGKKPSRYPIWFLRQAGRYLPEYQKIRSELDFLSLCRSPKKAMEVTIQPLKRFDLDAAIIFSDILVPPAHMGQNLRFDKGHGPLLSPTIRSEADLLKLTIPDAERDLGYVGEAISLCKERLNPSQAMIGFAGAPFTVASYMVEGSGSKTYSEVKKLMYQSPKTFSHLLDLLVETTYSYLKMQIKAGADIVMLFDSWAGHLNSIDYNLHVLPKLDLLVKQLRSENIPIIYYSGQGSEHLNNITDLDIQVAAIDWRTTMSRVGKIFRSKDFKPAVQGNLDPMLLSFGTEEDIRSQTKSILEQVRHEEFIGHIFNIGHGLLPSTSVKSIEWAIDEVRKFKTQ